MSSTSVTPGRSVIQPFLDRVLQRSILSTAEQNTILSLPVRTRQVHRDQDFVGLGQRVDHACLVIAGLVGRFDQSGSGARQITALHIAGDMPDLHSVVQPTATSALQALDTSTIMQIPHGAIRQAAADSPAIAEALWRDCMVDAMIMAQWVTNVGRRDAHARIAHLFCEMACRFKAARANNKVTYKLRMTQTHLADASGLTPVHVNRTLMSLREIGTSFRGSDVRIEDWAALAAAGDFNRNYLQDEIEPEGWLRLAH